MDEYADQLIAVVAEEAEHCERMLALLRHQQRRLIEGDTAGIESNMREQEAAIRRARELEKRRQSLLGKIAETEAFDGDVPDLSRLIASLSDDYGRRLKQLRESLSGAIGRITKVKEQNTMLIDRALFNIGETMRLFAAVPGMDGPTNGNGTRTAAAAPVSVDRIG